MADRFDKISELTKTRNILLHRITALRQATTVVFEAKHSAQVRLDGPTFEQLRDFAILALQAHLAAVNADLESV